MSYLLELMGKVKDRKDEIEVNEVISKIQNDGLNFQDILPILEHFKMGAYELCARTLKILNHHQSYKHSGYYKTLPRCLYFIKTFNDKKAHIEHCDEDLTNCLSKKLISQIKSAINADTLYKQSILHNKMSIQSGKYNTEKLTVILRNVGVDLEELVECH